MPNAGKKAEKVLGKIEDATRLEKFQWVKRSLELLQQKELIKYSFIETDDVPEGAVCAVGATIVHLAYPGGVMTLERAKDVVEAVVWDMNDRDLGEVSDLNESIHSKEGDFWATATPANTKRNRKYRYKQVLKTVNDEIKYMKRNGDDAISPTWADEHPRFNSLSFDC